MLCTSRDWADLDLGMYRKFGKCDWLCLPDRPVRGITTSKPRTLH